MKKYGSPIVVVNLVKKKEKARRRHEALIGDEYAKQVDYLNQFLPTAHMVRFVHLDMARCKKREDTEVMHMLADIAVYAVAGTGIYHSRPERGLADVRTRMGRKKDPVVEAYKEKVCSNLVRYDVHYFN